jgi:purine nucleosidase
MSMKKILLDMDVGIDDSIALAYAVASPNIELVGLSATFGNVHVGQSVCNARFLLDLLGAHDVPVEVGLPCPLGAERFCRSDDAARIHGTDGVGNVGEAYGVPVPSQDQLDAVGRGVDLILDAARRFGRELTLVPTGPLTNVAAAIRKDPETMAGIGGIVMMGGALTVTGNVTDAAEANIIADPLACKEVLESGLPVTMVGLDVTMRTHLTSKDAAAWRATGSRVGGYLADMVDHYIAWHASIPGMSCRCYAHDPSAVVCVAHPEWFQTLRLPLTCITEGPEAGRTTCMSQRVEYYHQATTQACVTVDAAAVERDINETLLSI